MNDRNIKEHSILKKNVWNTIIAVYRTLSQNVHPNLNKMFKKWFLTNRIRSCYEQMEHKGFSSAMIKGITTSAEIASVLYKQKK